MTAAFNSARPRLVHVARRYGGERAARIDGNVVSRRAALAALPSVLHHRFNRRMATELETVIELRVRASPGGPEASFGLRVSGGQLTVTRGGVSDAAAWISVSLGDMIRLMSDAATLWDLRADNRVAFGGEPFIALRVPQILGL